jgi:endonuclease YncB( thermonuclease family)
MLSLRGFAITCVVMVGTWLTAAPGPAHADPCHYIPDRGPLPAELHKGATFSGPVRYVGDGDSRCVGDSSEPRLWVEVRLADFYAPELHSPGGMAAKAALDRLARNRHAVCTAGARSYDRVVALCRIDGVSIGDLMRRAGVAEGGKGQVAKP